MSIFDPDKQTVMLVEQLAKDCIELLKQMINTPSISLDEEKVATVIRNFLQERSIPFRTLLNNTWCFNKNWDNSKPVILLNSHVDTVKPVAGWTYDPFTATTEGDKIIGLGSNDAGAPLVALLATFCFFYEKEELPFNLIFAATAEEEISGKKGMALLVNELERVDFAIVGEPTQMRLAIAEKGLIVLDGLARGKAGHAARNEGINSIYLAFEDIEKIRNYRFERISPLLGEVKMTVTQIEAGFQHNVVPDECKFVVDIRTNECYTNEEIVSILNDVVKSEITPRSLRLNSSGIDPLHPFVLRAKSLGIECFGSPTMSDQSLMPYQSVKIGPGDSARSHTANEYVFSHEIVDGIEKYISLLSGLQLR